MFQVVAEPEAAQAQGHSYLMRNRTLTTAQSAAGSASRSKADAESNEHAIAAEMICCGSLVPWKCGPGHDQECSAGPCGDQDAGCGQLSRLDESGAHSRPHTQHVVTTCDVTSAGVERKGLDAGSCRARRTSDSLCVAGNGRAG